MGQLFNRINRIIKANSISENYDASVYIKNEDDELKKIIDELNTDKSKNSANNNYKTNSNKENNQTTNNAKVFDETWAYSILELSPNCATGDIKKAYIQKIKEYHPDKVADLGAEIKKLAENKTKDINKAYEILKKVKGL